MESELYLVCRFIRRGRINSENKKTKKELHDYRRPFGAAVLNLSDRDEIFGSFGEEKEHNLSLFTTVNENDIVNLHDSKIKINFF